MGPQAGLGAQRVGGMCWPARGARCCQWYPCFFPRGFGGRKLRSLVEVVACVMDLTLMGPRFCTFLSALPVQRPSPSDTYRCSPPTENYTPSVCLLTLHTPVPHLLN